jgi:glyoxylase-like metal-dependent hydrolase (beta-lactamase superfamily II)
MWVEKQGRVNEDLYILGSHSNPIYLIGDNNFWTLIDAGVSFQHESVLGEISEIVGDLKQIKFWIITHSHYDHVGLLPSLAPLLDNVEIICSYKAARNFLSSKSLNVIYQLNKEAADLKGISILDENAFKAVFSSLPIITLKEGDSIEVLENNNFEIIATPGHSECSISLYDSINKRLWVADALGEKNKDEAWFPLAFESIASYEATVGKLLEFDVESIFLGHNGYWDLKGGNEMEDPLELLNEIKDTCNVISDDTKLINTLNNRFMAYSKDFLPAGLHLKSVERLIKNIRKNESKRGIVKV